MGPLSLQAEGCPPCYWRGAAAPSQCGSAAPKCTGVQSQDPMGWPQALSEGLPCPPPLSFGSPHCGHKGHLLLLLPPSVPSQGHGTCCPYNQKSLPQVTTGPSRFHPMSLLRKALPDHQAKGTGTHSHQGPAAIPSSCRSLCYHIPAGLEAASGPGHGWLTHVTSQCPAQSLYIGRVPHNAGQQMPCVKRKELPKEEAHVLTAG